MPKQQQLFTQEQLDVLNSNPYTYKATSGKLYFTLAFKEFFYSKVQEGVLTTSKIFEAAGYNPEMLGTNRMDHIRIRILREAKSPEGFKAPRGLSYQEELKKVQDESEKAKNADEKIQYLENRVAKLEAQIEFLKKTAHIRQQFQRTQKK